MLIWMRSGVAAPYTDKALSYYSNVRSLHKLLGFASHLDLFVTKQEYDSGSLFIMSPAITHCLHRKLFALPFLPIRQKINTNIYIIYAPLPMRTDGQYTVPHRMAHIALASSDRFYFYCFIKFPFNLMLRALELRLLSEEMCHCEMYALASCYNLCVYVFTRS